MSDRSIVITNVKQFDKCLRVFNINYPYCSEKNVDFPMYTYSTFHLRSFPNRVKCFYVLTYRATMINAVATVSRIADSEYFNGKATGPGGVDATSSLSRLDAMYKILMLHCAPARAYMRNALYK